MATPPYVIVRGDTLWDISRKYGISLAKLYEYNPVFKTNPKYKGGNLIWSGGRVWLQPQPGSTPKASTVAPAKPSAPPPPPPPPKIPTYEELMAKLTGPQRDAYEALNVLFSSYGLGSLSTKIYDMIRNGFQADTISIMLQTTDEYKKRFAANEVRLRKGLKVLSPAEYLATEQAYRQTLQAHGIPKDFWDTNEDLSNLIAADISPNELNERATLAEAALNGSPAKKHVLNNVYGLTDGALVAHLLDEDAALPVLKKEMEIAGIAGYGLNSGVYYKGPGQFGAADADLLYWSEAGYATDRAKGLQAAGVTEEQAKQGYGNVAAAFTDAMRLADIYTGRVTKDPNSPEYYDYNKYGLRDLEDEFLYGSGVAKTRRERLASQERAAFGGRTTTTSQGLGRRSQY